MDEKSPAPYKYELPSNRLPVDYLLNMLIDSDEAIDNLFLYPRK